MEWLQTNSVELVTCGDPDAVISFSVEAYSNGDKRVLQDDEVVLYMKTYSEEEMKATMG